MVTVAPQQGDEKFNIVPHWGNLEMLKAEKLIIKCVMCLYWSGDNNSVWMLGAENLFYFPVGFMRAY